MESVILVPFEGEGSGTFDLTWGQLEIWSAMCDQNSSLPIGGPMAVPPGATVEHAEMTLRYIMNRHQTLRTRLIFDPDADGGVRQELHTSGEVPLRIIDIASDEDPQEVTTALFESMRAEDFDYADEWPIRMAVVRQDGVTTHSVVVYCHIAMDARGLTSLIEDLAGLDFATGIHPSPAEIVQPIDQARWQAGEEGRRHHDGTVKRWNRQLARIPSRRFDDSGDERTPRYWHATYESPASHLASRLICERTRADATAVMLAAAAVEMARATGHSPSVLQTVVHNRFRPGMADVVAPIAQSALCVIDVADVPFDEVVAKAWRASIQAYMNSYYNPVRLDEAVARLGLERGEEIDLDCYFNDRRGDQARSNDGPVPTPDEVTRALARGRMVWREPTVDPVARFFLTIEDGPDLLSILMESDTRFVAPAETENVLRGIERTLVEAALNPAAMTGIRIDTAQAPRVHAA